MKLTIGIAGTAGVLHIATITSMNPNPEETIPPVITASVNALKTAMKEPSVKRFVYTSSSMAAYTPKLNTPMNITTETWNDEAVQIAWKKPYPPTNGYMVYGASKTQAEQEMWKYYREHRDERPDFAFNTVLPNANIGKMIDVKNQGFPSTVGFTKMLWDGDLEGFKQWLAPQYWVDVQDDARIHLAALLLPDVKEERIFAFAETFTWNQLLQGFRKSFPNRKFPDDVENPPEELAKVPNERALELLKRTGRDGWTALDQSLAWVGQVYEEAEK
jgi:nucleoside-diphosphate-sugar epimerase